MAVERPSEGVQYPERRRLLMLTRDGLLAGGFIALSFGTGACASSPNFDGNKLERKDDPESKRDVVLNVGLGLAAGGTVAAISGGILAAFMAKEDSSGADSD